MNKFFNGIKFFSDNIALINLGGTATASSAADDAFEAFNGNKAFGWMSFGEADDTKTAYLERNFGTALYGDTLIIANHNLKPSFTIKINDTAIISFKAQTQRGFTVISFPYREDIQKIRIEAAETMTADEEKQIGEIMLLTTVGQFVHPQELKNTLTREQGDLKLQNGKHFIFNCGTAWSFTIDVFALEQADIELLQTLQGLGSPFYMWPCGGDESQFEYHFRPFLFSDFFKVAFSGSGKPNLKDNIYWTGLRDSIKLVEVE